MDSFVSSLKPVRHSSTLQPQLLRLKIVGVEMEDVILITRLNHEKSFCTSGADNTANLVEDTRDEVELIVFDYRTPRTREKRRWGFRRPLVGWIFRDPPCF